MFESFESMHMWKISKTIVCSFETIGLRKSVFTKNCFSFDTNMADTPLKKDQFKSIFLLQV